MRIIAEIQTSIPEVENTPCHIRLHYQAAERSDFLQPVGSPTILGNHSKGPSIRLKGQLFVTKSIFCATAMAALLLARRLLFIGRPLFSPRIDRSQLNYLPKDTLIKGVWECLVRVSTSEP